jgi:beta-ureidopropionase
MKTNRISRRSFMQKTAVTAGLISSGTLGIANNFSAWQPPESKLPREVWIASFSQMDLHAETPELMVKKVLELLKGLEPYHPDFVCLPEVFAFTNVKKEYAKHEWSAISEGILEQFSDYSRKNNCYTICPVYTIDDQRKIYNSAVAIDRQGNQIGTYKKIHPTEGEIESGTTPGPLFQPVIQTDFGKVGIQICFDVMWYDGWVMYRKQGAEIIFFPSAFPAGQMVNAKAWQNKCVVASSTNKHTSKICDITGEEITKTGIWDANLCCAPVNLEKAFLHLWPFNERFPEIHEKYGRHAKITLFHEEEWAIIESLSPDIKVKDILKEFDLKKHEELTRDTTTIQENARR